MNDYIDVLKGSPNQKVLSAKHDQLQLHGRFKEFKKEDIERLLRKMMSEGLIKEEVKKLEFENIAAYIRLGDKAKNFYTGGRSLEFPVVQGAASKARLDDFDFGEAIDFDAVQRADRPSTSSGVRGGRAGSSRGHKDQQFRSNRRNRGRKKKGRCF